MARQRTSGVGLAVALLLWGGPLAAQVGGAPPRRLSLDQAVELARAQDPGQRLAQARVAELEATRKSLRGRLGPSLQAEGRILRWDSASDLEVIDPESLDLSAVPQPFADLLGGMLTDLAAPLRLRDETTAQLSLSLVQPLTPLYSVAQGQAMAAQGRRAAEAQARSSERELVFQTTRAYLGVLRAERLGAVARQACGTIEAHLADARKVQLQGLVGQEELLRGEVELARARQRALRAEEGRSLALALLRKLTGLPADQALELEPLPAGDLRADRLAALPEPGAALQTRPELAALQAAVAAAEHDLRRVRWDLVPQVAAVARVEHAEGIAMQPANEAFVGAVLDWKIWEWGRTHYEIEAAQQRLEQARARLLDVEGKLRLQIEQARLGLEMAGQELAVAQVGARQAAEGLRLSHARFGQGVSSSTELLDAQTRHDAAQASLVAARYRQLEALAALRLALGEGQTPSVRPDDLEPAAQVTAPAAAGQAPHEGEVR